VNHHNKELGNFLKAKKRVWRPMPWIFISLRHNFSKFLKQGSVLTTKRGKPTMPNKPGEWVSEWVSEWVCSPLWSHTHTCTELQPGSWETIISTFKIQKKNFQHSFDVVVSCCNL
jgi:hypothetical protein